MPSTKGRSRRYWYVFVAGLDPSVMQASLVVERNPYYLNGLPAVYVGYIWNEAPEQRFPDGHFDASRSHILRKFGQTIIPRFTSRHANKESCLRGQELLIAVLRDDGWLVANHKPKRSYYVYVVELQPSVAGRPGVTQLNPNRNPSLPCVYVGQSSKTPEARLKDHVEKRHSSRFVTSETVVTLRPDLYGPLNPLTELESLIVERQLGETLRAHGWTVVGAH